MVRPIVAVVIGLVMGVPPVQAQDAAALTARYAVLRTALAHNAYHLPLFLESKEASGEVDGDVYARLKQPFAVVGPALQGIDHWCDILILHLNVKSCRATHPPAGVTLRLHVGRKFDQPLADTYPFEFLYAVVAAAPDYLQVTLNAAAGPIGTRRYRITLEVVALDHQRSFLHLSYSYAYGMAARAAMQGYLATMGRGKIGFSVIGSGANGQPLHVGSLRGAVERNTMRYYLAIDAYLDALSAPAPERLDRRLNAWQSGVERFPTQLRELERAPYLAMKYREVERQQTPGTASEKR